MITAVILTKNEEKNIKECILSLKWVDKIIVVDDYSTDNTVQIARANRAIVYKRNLNGDFSSQRNYAISKAETDWILMVDADERISEELRNEILGVLDFKSEKEAYYLRRVDCIWGKKIKFGEQGNVSLIRFFKKNNNRFNGKIHETLISKSKTGKLNNPIIHFPHQTTSEFLKEINFYTDIRASELFENKIKTNLLLIFLYPLCKFIKDYILLLGIFDGIRGLILAIMMSMHSFLVRGKLWLLWKKK